MGSAPSTRVQLEVGCGEALLPLGPDPSPCPVTGGGGSAKLCGLVYQHLILGNKK